MPKLEKVIANQIAIITVRFLLPRGRDGHSRDDEKKLRRFNLLH